MVGDEFELEDSRFVFKMIEKLISEYEYGLDSDEVIDGIKDKIDSHKERVNFINRSK